MKHMLIALICLLVASGNAAAQTADHFDIATFRAPAGWKKTVREKTVTFITDDGANAYCLVTLFKSMPSLGEPKENFDASWATIVKEAVNASDAQMMPSDNKGGWQAVGGFSPFEKDGQKGAVVLLNLSGYGTMVNVLVLTNTQKFEPVMTDFLQSISLKAPAVQPARPVAPVAPAASASDTSIVGTWGQNLGAHMSYGDPVAAGMAGYSKDQYTFNANGTYTFVSKTFRMSYDKIILVRENGTYQAGGGSLLIKPQKSVIEAWSKANGGDRFGQLVSRQNRTLETVTYRYTRHYFSGIDQWQLVLQADQPTQRDGPFSTFKLFPNAWYYSPISSNNPVVELPR
ncbi:MAG: hypothetical protein ABI791_09155 [Acidobacteriota bacterium]